MILLTKLQANNVIDMAITNQGHSFAGMIVSFAIIV